MALYFYQAFSKDGKRVSGYLDASSQQQVKEQLSKQGLFPSAIAPATYEVQIPWWQRFFSRAVSAKDKITLTRQLAVLLRSGVPLLQALELLTEQFSGHLRVILVKIKDDIKAGQSFADALKKYPTTFETLYVQLVRAGEASGRLEIILDRLTQYLERQEEIRKRIQSALQYPIIQLIVSLLVLIFLLVKVVPTMTETLAGFGKELPSSTKLVVAISDFLVNHYLVCMLGCVIVVSAALYWKATAGGARLYDKIKLKIPIIGYFARMHAIVQFSYTLGMLLESGVGLAQALDIVCSIVDNRILANTLNEARDKIIKQGKLAQYLKQTEIFPSIAMYLINTGEESGTLDTMLLTVARDYEQDLKELADNLSGLIGPVMLIVMGIMVGFIVLAIALPMMQMAGNVGTDII